ncbi:hypothetical protein QTP70_028993 [Hemibagrus guttatus]|uniref:Opioid growth factor receptor (OGFr) conserved domain-containing protein n=1 Tax=Hemibagrus guttatus TaxID=175788 RepID=A0AAE0UPA5_9TELE|nr:hypothetical protein QTP70_028993 [Hemibagrus guttatus]
MNKSCVSFLLQNTLEKLDFWTDDMNDDEDLPNLRFYRNQKKFKPDGVYIDDFHKHWFGDYHNLEYVHSYIQWLFPIQEKGLNFASRELSLTEIKLFCEDEEMKKRLLTSYKLMLDFYGIQLVNEDTGEVRRAENWREQFENLNRNTHNNLRITRILKCLGLLGFKHYQAPLVHFFLVETLVNERLPRVKKSALDYFMFAVLDKTERKNLIRFAFTNFEPKEDFVWCPWRICYKFLKEEESLKFSAGPSEGMSNDSTSQSNQNQLMNSSVENEDESKTDEGTSNNKHLSSRNDETVPDAHQESEKQALPIPVAGTNTSDINKDNEALPGVDSQHDSQKASESQATIQKADAKARNEKIPNSEQKATERSDENGNDYADSSTQSEVLSDAKNLDSSGENTQTSNHSTASENASKETPLPGRNPGSERQDQGEKFERGNKDELISQLSERDSRENDSEVNQKSGGESPEDSVGTGSGTNNEANSVDMYSHKYTESDESIVQSLQEGSEQNPCDELKRTKEEADENKKDSVHPSMEDDPEDRNADWRVRNPVTSNNNQYSDSTDDKDRENTESEQASAHRSDNSSQVIPGKDTETGEEKSVEGEKTETGCEKDGGNAEEENTV